MKRFILVLCVSCGSLFSADFASAQSPTSTYVANLRALGYGRVEVSRTFLGRYRIIAHREGAVREIIMARNGMVLFDYLDVTSRPPTPPAPLDDDPEQPSSPAPDPLEEPILEPNVIDETRDKT